MRHRLVLLWLVPLILAAAHRERPAPTGLRILSTTMESPTALNPELRQVAITVQNVTADKTVVAYGFLTREFDRNGQEINPHQSWIGTDFAEPDGKNSSFYIPPGQIRTIGVYSVRSPETVSVKVTVTGLVYEDRTAEGHNSEEIFTARRYNAREARELAAQEPPGPRKTELEKRAAWFEAAAVEAER